MTAMKGDVMSDLKAIGQIIGDVAAQDPEAVAITCGHRSITRDELDRQSNRLARRYQQLGVGHGDFVTIGLPNSIEFYLACFAAWKLGAVPQPVSHRLPDRERRAIIELAAPSLVVGGEPLADDSFTQIPGDLPSSDISDAPLPVRISPAWKAPTSGGSHERVLCTGP